MVGRFYAALILSVGFSMALVSDAVAQGGKKGTLGHAGTGFSAELAKHNAVADRCGIERVKTKSRMAELVKEGILLPVLGGFNWLDLRVPQAEFAYLRKEAKDYLEEVATDFYIDFSKPFKVTEVMRDEPYQSVLVRSRRRGASSNAHCVVPSQCTLHFTGLAFDISKRSLETREYRWLHGKLKQAREASRISFFSESSNFHVTVHPICDGVKKSAAK